MRLLLPLLIVCFFAAPSLGADSIRIGVSLGLSGKYEKLATMQKRGFELWVAEVNDRGGLLGREVQMVVRDDRSDKETARALYREMIEQQNVDLIFGPYSSGLTEAVADIAEEHGFPMLASGASADTIWTKGREYTFGVYSPASRYALGFLEMLVMHDLSRLAMVTARDAFSLSLAQGVRKWAALLGHELVLDETVEKGVVDFGREAALAREAGAEVVIMCGHFDEAVHMRQALEKLGWEPRAYYASVGPVLEDYREKLGPAAEGAFSSTQWQYHEDLSFPGAQEFYASFLERYGVEPSYQAATAYAAGQILDSAVRRTESLDHEKLRTIFSSMDTLTILGRYGVDVTGMQIRHQAMIIQWQNGEKEIVWPEKLRSAQPVFAP